MEKVGLIHDPARDFDHPNLPNWSGIRAATCSMRSIASAGAR